MVLCCDVLILVSPGFPAEKTVTLLIGVYLSFDSVPEAGSVEVMKRAVEAILQPAGIA